MEMLDIKKQMMGRRKFLKNTLIIPFYGSLASVLNTSSVYSANSIKSVGANKIKISLNAFSFNKQLSDGTINLFDLLDFCAAIGFDALDTTAYYFPNYPNTPNDNYIYALKRKAFLLGLEISGTGVRNDFSNPDKDKRRADINLIKDWIICASKLGAPVIRIFSGKEIPQGYNWEQIFDWMIDDIKECVEFGRNHGVLVAVQNHNEYLKTSDEIHKLISLVNSDWFGLTLDIGSLRMGDPYEEIEKVAKYALSWQIKEHVYYNNEKVETDYGRIINIAKQAGYRGYLPLETLVRENTEDRVKQLFKKFSLALNDN
jgi:sugar phosphate isomerase/epimerase